MEQALKPSECVPQIPDMVYQNINKKLQQGIDSNGRANISEENLRKCIEYDIQKYYPYLSYQEHWIPTSLTVYQALGWKVQENKGVLEFSK